jgi:cytoskeletal protein CcmA (bactofilin family)
MRNFSFEQRDDAAEARGSTFPSSSSAERAQAAGDAERKIAILGPTLRFKGELSAEEDFILQGRIEGSIHHTQSVTIGAEGSVLGNIHARVITIDGSVEGDLHGAEAVLVHATGRVAGNIFAPRVGLVEGAFFNGRIEMPDPRAAAARPAARAPEKTGQPLSADETERMLSGKQV